MPLKTHMDEQPELNLTPMIDIVFLLIIFFMVSTKVSEMERKIALDVPRISNTEALTPAPRKRVVNILQDGRILLDEEEVAALRERVDGEGHLIRHHLEIFSSRHFKNAD